MNVFVYVFYVYTHVPLHAFLRLEGVILSPSHNDGAKVTFMDGHWGHQHGTFTAGGTWTEHITYRRARKFGGS